MNGGPGRASTQNDFSTVAISPLRTGPPTQRAAAIPAEVWAILVRFRTVYELTEGLSFGYS